jgi:hypothetical protein
VPLPRRRSCTLATIETTGHDVFDVLYSFGEVTHFISPSEIQPTASCAVRVAGPPALLVRREKGGGCFEACRMLRERQHEHHGQ